MVSEEDKFIADVKACLGTPEGKRVLAVLERSYMGRLSFSNDSHLTAFYEGQRDVAMRLIRIINYENETV